MFMFMKLVFRQGNTVCIGILSLLILLSFSDSDATMCFLKVRDYKNSRFFHGGKNIHLICLISATVTYNDYHSQSDRLSS